MESPLCVCVCVNMYICRLRTKPATNSALMESRLCVCVCVCVCVCEYVYLQIAHEACHSLSDVLVVGAAVEKLKDQTQV